MKDSKINNFWASCPANYKYIPTSPCDHGKPTFKGKKLDEDPPCPWWVNSEKHQYCFWRYLRDHSASDGSMKELQLSDIAKLLGWSSTKAHFSMKEAMDELLKVFNSKGIDTRLLTEEFQDQIIVKNDYTMVDPE